MGECDRYKQYGNEDSETLCELQFPFTIDEMQLMIKEVRFQLIRMAVWEALSTYMIQFLDHMEDNGYPYDPISKFADYLCSYYFDNVVIATDNHKE